MSEYIIVPKIKMVKKNKLFLAKGFGENIKEIFLIKIEFGPNYDF